MNFDTLYKTTVVIWSRNEPNSFEDVACDVLTVGVAYVSSVTSEHIEVPERDKDWDGNGFFGEPKEE